MKDTISIILHVLLLIASVLLVVVILKQDAKSAGLGSAFGNDTTALGRSRNAKVSKEVKLQKLTIGFAIAVGVIALILLILS